MEATVAGVWSGEWTWVKIISVLAFSFLPFRSLLTEKAVARPEECSTQAFHVDDGRSLAVALSCLPNDPNEEERRQRDVLR